MIWLIVLRCTVYSRNTFQEAPSINKVHVAFNEAVKMSLESENFNCFKIFSQNTKNDNLGDLIKFLNSKTSQIINAEVVSRVSVCENSIIILHAEKNLNKFDDTIENFSRPGKVLALLLDGQHEISQLSEIFQRFLDLAYIDVNVVTTANESSIVMVSFIPFQAGSCRNVQPIIVNSFNKSSNKWSHSEMFPKKLANFQNCPLKISTLEYPPAVMKKLEKGKSKLFGSDIEVINGLAAAMNFRVNFSYVADPYNFGTILENGSGTGAIHHIMNGEADVVIGFYFLNYEKLSSLSNSYP